MPLSWFQICASFHSISVLHRELILWNQLHHLFAEGWSEGLNKILMTDLFLPGFLAGPSGIRAGWVLETKSRLGAE